MKGAWVLALLAILAVRASADPLPPLSLSLEEAESLALSNSDDLRIQKLKVQSAARRFDLGIRDFLPQLELGISSSDAVNVGAEDSPSNQVSVTLRQPVYNGGRTLLQRSLSRLQLTLSTHSLVVSRANILNDVWDKYHRVLVLEAQRAVKEETLAKSRQQLDIARKEQELGISREIDLVGVELSVSNQEMDLESAINDLEQAVYALKKSLGVSPDQEIKLKGSIDSRYTGLAIDRTATWFVTIATANNLDLQTTAFKVTQMEAQVAVARSQYLPQVEASVTFSLSGPGLPLQTPAVSLGVDVSFPESAAPVKTSVTGGVTGSSSTTQSLSVTADPLQSVTGYLDDVDAVLQLEDARSALKQQTRDLSFQIGQLLSAYKRQSTAIRIGNRSIDLEQKKLRVLTQQVADGSATRVDLLEEETTAANLEVNVLSDVLALIGTERSLEKLLGIEPGGLSRLIGGQHEGS